MTVSEKSKLRKFLLLLFIITGYFGYLIFEYGVATGGLVAILTWSFFVLCTPIADAGFLIDFPIRLVTNVKMFVSEILVWVIAISVNIYALTYESEIYDKEFLTTLLKHTILTPYPYWGIIILSAFGSFLSVYFSDEIFDVIKNHAQKNHAKHHFKLKTISLIVLAIVIFIAYYFLLESLGIDLHAADR